MLTSFRLGGDFMSFANVMEFLRIHSGETSLVLSVFVLLIYWILSLRMIVLSRREGINIGASGMIPIVSVGLLLFRIVRGIVRGISNRFFTIKPDDEISL